MITMKLFTVLSSIAIVQAGVVKENENPCDGVVINGVYHEKEILKEGIDRPYMLSTDYATNTLYFSYNVNVYGEDEKFKVAKVDLDTNEFSNLEGEGVQNGCAQTVDPKSNEVYVGGTDGIYKYNPNTKNVEHIGAKGDDIWYVYYKDGVLYYLNFPQQFLYTIKDGEAARFKDLEDIKVDFFVIDKNNEMFYTNATGLYSQKKGTKDAVLYSKFGNTTPRTLTTDVNGNVYLCFQDGIYKVVQNNTSIELLVNIENAFGVAFDRDNNIVYSDANKLVRLKPNKDKSCREESSR